ncbi:SRSO17 transposase [Kribbella steppae]|uniref:SRSO17 transposase n=2 Tax=Kribbella steppae TaxID=2512223 RepID=A0A4R2GQD3_9ACTN|nr:SRSO17 transposase [Kribbella steppae]
MAVAAGHSIDPGRWRAEFDALMARVAGRFARVEPRRLAGDAVRGLMSDLAVKNCWTLAEHAGHESPDGLQHLLGKAKWDTDGVRDDLRDYVVARLGRQDALLVVDETGDVKKGTHTVGVQRQYTGTAGRIENAQVAVYLTYATAAGHALIDRELYVPQVWADDVERREQAGVPAEVEFDTKPALAAAMVTRGLDAGVAVDWVTGDEVYGGDPKLRVILEDRGVGYVLAVACSHHVRTEVGKQRTDELVASLPRKAWQRLSAGNGSKGPRYYDWAWISIHPDRAEIDGQWWLLIRRNTTSGELAYYRCWAPTPVPLRDLVRVAGRRWTIEESFQAAKTLTGLDQHQVRRWTSWHRWTILAMLAYAFLAVVAATERAENPTPQGNSLIALTCNEIKRLFNTYLAAPTLDLRHRLRWSIRRRRHQHRARTSHYQRRQARTP